MEPIFSRQILAKNDSWKPAIVLIKRPTKHSIRLRPDEHAAEDLAPIKARLDPSEVGKQGIAG